MGTLDPPGGGSDADPGRLAHAVMVGMTEPGQRILELGCSTGAMTRALVDRGCSVVGVETDAAAGDQARDVAKVITADIASLDFGAELGEERFDVVTFGDVVGRLPDPAATLRASRAVLADDGYVVVCVPNVAHGDVRLSLLQGDFGYRPVGLLDRTQVRFFTLESVEELLRDAGVVSVHVERVEVPLFETELELDRGDFQPDLVDRVEAEPESRTYQFVIKAVPADRDDGLRALYERAEQSRAEAARLRTRLRRLDTVVERSERECDALRIDLVAARTDRADVERERDALRAQLDALHNTKVMRVLAPLRRYYARWRRHPPPG